eukprot:889030-Rhodomonas_salina.1
MLDTHHSPLPRTPQTAAPRPALAPTELQPWSTLHGGCLQPVPLIGTAASLPLHSSETERERERERERARERARERKRERERERERERKEPRTRLTPRRVQVNGRRVLA